MKTKFFSLIVFSLSLFCFSQTQKRITFFSNNEVRQISSYGNGGCLYSTFSTSSELVKNQIFIIETDGVYFVKINGVTNLLSKKNQIKNQIFAENYFYKLIINLNEENNGVIKLFDKNVYGSKKEKVMLTKKINRSCGD